MANTNINITEAAGLLVPDVSSVDIIAGDTITFIAGTETAVKLCMSAETAALLGATESAQVAAGGSLALTFSGTPTGNHGVALQFPDKKCPSKIKGGTGATLHIAPASKSASPIPPDEPDPPPSGSPGGEN
jgi:hypothetical protein